MGEDPSPNTKQGKKRKKKKKSRFQLLSHHFLEADKSDWLSLLLPAHLPHHDVLSRLNYKAQWTFHPWFHVKYLATAMRTVTNMLLMGFPSAKAIEEFQGLHLVGVVSRRQSFICRNAMVSFKVTVLGHFLPL